jgi:hypothetical protein
LVSSAWREVVWGHGEADRKKKKEKKNARLGSNLGPIGVTGREGISCPCEDLDGMIPNPVAPFPSDSGVLTLCFW